MITLIFNFMKIIPWKPQTSSQYYLFINSVFKKLQFVFITTFFLYMYTELFTENSFPFQSLNISICFFHLSIKSYIYYLCKFLWLEIYNNSFHFLTLSMSSHFDWRRQHWWCCKRNIFSCVWNWYSWKSSIFLVNTFLHWCW